MTAARRRRDRRHQSREAALQMLYHWEVGRSGIDNVVAIFWNGSDERPALGQAGQAFANELVHGTVQHLPEIDPLIAAASEHWRLGRLAIVDRLILRLAVYEFLHGQETPKAVVINEALELARTFSSDDAVKFVNGVLDGIRRRLEGEAQPPVEQPES